MARKQTARLASALIAALAIAAPKASAGPQSAGTRPFRPVAGPLERIAYDVATGEITRLTGARARAGRGGNLAGARELESSGLTVNAFLNTNTMGFFSTGTTGTEWRDWAGKSTGLSGVVDQFYFAYATSANDVGAGGPGAAIEVAFYTGETGFCTATGVEIAKSRFCFTGLPGASTSLPTNVGVGFLVTAFAPAKTFCVPDGKVGWSYGFKDDDGSGNALTGPLMTSFVTANTCAADAFDLYAALPSSDGSCAGSFFFGGCEPLPQPPAPVGTPCANFYVGLGVHVHPPAATFHGPSGCNDATFASSDVPPGPALGKMWNSTVSPVLHDLCHLRVTAGTCHPSGLKVGGCGATGTAVYALSPLVFSGSAPGCGDPFTWSLPVQKNHNLAGALFCAQSIGVDFGPLTTFCENAENLEVGSTFP